MSKNVFCFLLQINVKLKSEIPVHVDGEPWYQPPGNIIIRPTLSQVRTML